MADWQYRNTLQFVWAPDISLYQMTAAYTTFKPTRVHLESPFLYCALPTKWQEIYRADPIIRPKPSIRWYNAIMVDMLKNVVGGEFTMGLKTENGGKTGTTNDFSDGWFMGVTPHWW